jgi:hypothetical protein
MGRLVYSTLVTQDCIWVIFIVPNTIRKMSSKLLPNILEEKISQIQCRNSLIQAKSKTFNSKSNTYDANLAHSKQNLNHPTNLTGSGIVSN